jgi:hypothetical protein
MQGAQMNAPGGWAVGCRRARALTSARGDRGSTERKRSTVHALAGYEGVARRERGRTEREVTIPRALASALYWWAQGYRVERVAYWVWVLQYADGWLNSFSI